MNSSHHRVNCNLRLAHSLLISRFLKPSLPILLGDERQLDAWATALGETPGSALEKLKRESLLVSFEPSSSDELLTTLDSLYTVLDLKAKLKQKTLKVSGKKMELMERLVAADGQGLHDEIATLGLYHCSESGRQFASLFDTRKSEALEAALTALEQRDFGRAIHTYQVLEGELGFPKWELEGSPTPKLLEAIMNVRPEILHGCSDHTIHTLRLAAAIAYVAGRHAPRNLLRDVETGIHLDAKTSSRMIYFAAIQLQNLTDWKRMGIATIEHLASGDSCTACQALNGQQRQIESAPELPYARCTHKLGCRCLYQPVRGL